MRCTCKGDNRSGTAQLCEQCGPRDTCPPSAPDHTAADFERDVRERGEDSARWDRHMARIAELFGEGRST